jgi:hypothetical protein
MAFYPCFSLWPLALFGAAGVATASPAPGADPSHAADVVALAPYVVKDNSAVPEKEKGWSYAEEPDLEILTQTTAASTQAIVRNLRILDQALGVVWPNLLSFPQARLTLVICNTEAKYEAMVPATIVADKPTPLAYPPDEAGGEATAGASGGATHEPLERFDVIAQSTPLRGAGLNFIVTTFPEGSLRYDDQLDRAYLLARLAAVRPRLPAFFEEGLAELAGEMVITKGGIKVGVFSSKPDTIPGSMLPTQQFGNPSTSLSQRNQSKMTRQTGRTSLDSTVSVQSLTITKETNRRFLHYNHLLPLDAVLAVAHDAPATFQPRSIWALESEAFVHMCLYGSKPYGYPAELGKYLEAVAAAGVAPVGNADLDRIFTASFGKKPAEMESLLATYLADGMSQNTLLRPKKSGSGPMYTDPAPVIFREATDGQIARIEGNADFLAGALDAKMGAAAASAQQINAARAEFTDAYCRGERDPKLLAAWGLFEFRVGDDLTAARRVLEAAIAAGTESRPAYLALAQLRQAAAKQ